MSHIFISYSRADGEFAERLASDLTFAGANVWIDVDAIPAGMKWSTGVQQGLDTCEVMLVIISPDSMASRNVEDEWQAYIDDNKPVLPVLWKPTRVHFQLRRIQYVNFHQQDYDTAYAQLHSELRRKGIHLDPLTEDDLSIELPNQDPLPSFSDSADDSTASGADARPRERTPEPSAAHTNRVGYTHPQYEQPNVPAWDAPSPPQPDYAPVQSSTHAPLLQQTAQMLRQRQWAITSESANGIWAEGWSYGDRTRQQQMKILIWVASAIFSLFGAVAAGWIASRSFKERKISFTPQPDGRLILYGDLGSFTITSTAELMTVLDRIEIEKNPMGGYAPWVIAITIGVISACIWSAILESMAAATTPIYY